MREVNVYLLQAVCTLGRPTRWETSSLLGMVATIGEDQPIATLCVCVHVRACVCVRAVVCGLCWGAPHIIGVDFFPCSFCGANGTIGCTEKACIGKHLHVASYGLGYSYSGAKYTQDVCVCVCVCACARARVRVRVCARVRARVRVRVRVCVCVCLREAVTLLAGNLSVPTRGDPPRPPREPR